MSAVLDEGFEEAHVIFVLVLRIVDEGTIRRVVLNHPQIGEMLNDVAVAVEAPFLVRAANPIDANLRCDVGCIVQCLCHIFQTAPYQYE